MAVLRTELHDCSSNKTCMVFKTVWSHASTIDRKRWALESSKAEKLPKEFSLSDLE